MHSTKKEIGGSMTFAIVRVSESDITLSTVWCEDPCFVHWATLAIPASILVNPS